MTCNTSAVASLSRSQRLVALGGALGKLPLQIGFQMILRSANVLSGIALICGPRPEPTFRADHTVIGTGHHGMSIGATSVASANDCYGQRIGSGSAREWPAWCSETTQICATLPAIG